MKTSELINRLMESVLKFGDQEVVGEMQIVHDGEPLMGRRVPLLVTADATRTTISFQFKGQNIPTLLTPPKLENREPLTSAQL